MTEPEVATATKVRSWVKVIRNHTLNDVSSEMGNTS